jgi:anthranilate phosphoribosyltransferase
VQGAWDLKGEIMLKPYIKKAAERENLTSQEMKEAMEIMMTGKSSEAQIAAFLTALKMKGETVEEISAAAMVMREKAHYIKIDKEVILDTCGTGGDYAETFNISTAVSVVAAACGVTVAKHGNRALTSKSGSADVLKALGVNVDASHDNIKNSIENIGIGFLFAPGCHMAMKYAAPVRREIGIRNIFNVLGPIINPARNTHHLMGVYAGSLTEKIAAVLKNMGNVHSLVICGEGNVDEAVLWGNTSVAELKDGKITTYSINPEEFGIEPCTQKEVIGSSPEENAAIMAEVFAGKRKDAYYRIIVYNGAIALYTADAVKSIKDGVLMAKDAIDSGRAADKLKQLVEYSNK